MKVLLVNGPNLNLLGSREPEIYGSTTLPEIEQQVIHQFKEAGVDCLSYQSNIEGELINWLHEHRNADFLIINPGAFTHTSIALRDAISGIGMNQRFLEVHISNVHAREPFRHHSYLSDIALGTIVGLGVQGYFMATDFVIKRLKQ